MKFEALTNQMFSIQKVLEFSPNPVMIVNSSDQIVYVNEAYEKLSGYLWIEIDGVKIDEFLKGEYVSKCLPYWKSYLNTPDNSEPLFIRDIKIQRKDGQFLHVDIGLNHIAFRNANLIYISVNDQTEQRKIIERLEQYQYFFLKSNDLSCIANTNGYFEKISPRFEEKLGYPESELLGKPFIDFIHPDDIKSTLKEIEKLKQGALTINFKNRYRKKDGDYLWLEWNTTPDTATGKLYAIARDITERINVESKLKLTTERLILALRGLGAGLFEVNLTTGKRWWGPNYYKLLGYKNQEIEPNEENLRKMIDPEMADELFSCFDDCVRKRKRFEREVRYLTKRGRYKWFNVTAHIETDKKNNSIRMVGSIVDIDKRKKAEILSQNLATKNLLKKTAIYNLKILAEKKAYANNLLLNVLYNVFPKSIAKRIIKGEEEIVEHFKNCSVLFADTVGFTQWSASLNPKQLAQHLDYIFRLFDELAAQYGVEKIKTIGDAYMCATGVPEPCKDHGSRIAKMALEMNKKIREHYPDGEIRLRIGIDTGDLTAGVLSRSKYAYDLWGDTVNTASRMESHSLPEKIQVTEKFKRLLEGKFRFEERGEIEVKGKGKMRTWFLVDG